MTPWLKSENMRTRVLFSFYFHSLLSMAKVLLEKCHWEDKAIVICFLLYHSEECRFNIKLPFPPLLPLNHSDWEGHLLVYSALTKQLTISKRVGPYSFYKPWTPGVIKHCSSSIKWNKKSSWQTLHLGPRVSSRERDFLKVTILVILSSAYRLSVMNWGMRGGWVKWVWVAGRAGERRSMGLNALCSSVSGG